MVSASEHTQCTTDTTAVYALTKQSAALGAELSKALGAQLFLPLRLAEEYGAKPFDALAPLVSESFKSYRNHVFLCATGIVIRTIAPLLQDKYGDPAVVVLDPIGTYVISLVAGHIGGANVLARRVAALTGGKAILTTATDSVGAPAIELLAKNKNLALRTPDMVKVVNRALAEGEYVQVYDPESYLLTTDFEWYPWFRKCMVAPTADTENPVIRVDWHKAQGNDPVLELCPRVLVAGVGCRKGATTEEILNAVSETLESLGILPEALCMLASHECKKDEDGLHLAAEKLKVPLKLYSSDALNSMPVTTPSETVKKHLGVESVCEAAALLASKSKSLLSPKQILGNVTVALAHLPHTECCE